MAAGITPLGCSPLCWSFRRLRVRTNFRTRDRRIDRHASPGLERGNLDVIQLSPFDHRSTHHRGFPLPELIINNFGLPMPESAEKPARPSPLP